MPSASSSTLPSNLPRRAATSGSRLAGQASTAHAEPTHQDHVSDATLARAAALLKAAGSPDRLRLLECLSEGEFCVTGLAEHLGEAVTTTSNRLQLLQRAGWVVRRREDRHQYYRLADDHVLHLLQLALEHAGHLPND